MLAIWKITKIEYKIRTNKTIISVQSEGAFTIKNKVGESVFGKNDIPKWHVYELFNKSKIFLAHK